MVLIQNKRLMSCEGLDCDFSPNINDFMFFEGGGGKGGGTKVVYVPQVQEKTEIRKAPDPIKQEGASNIKEGATDDDELIGGRRRALGGTRKLTIPVTPSR